MGWVREYTLRNGTTRFAWCWRDSGNAQREKKGFASRRAAKRWGENEASLIPPKSEDVPSFLAGPALPPGERPFADFALQWWHENGSHATRRSASTRELYEQHLTGYLTPSVGLGALKLNEIDHRAMVSFAHRLTKWQRRRKLSNGKQSDPLPELSNATKNRILSLARTILNEARRHGEWSADIEWGRILFPEDEEDLPELSDELIGMLLDALPDKGDYRQLIYVLSTTGLRVSEALGLKARQCRFNDNDDEPAKIIVRHQKNRRRGHDVVRTKTQTSRREVEMGAAESVLRELCKKRPSGFLFRSSVGAPLDLHRLRARQWATGKERVAEKLTEAGREDEAAHVLMWKIHWLRHRFAIEAIRRGASPEFLAEQMGHSSFYITQRYTKHWRARRAPERDTLLFKPALHVVAAAAER